MRTIRLAYRDHDRTPAIYCIKAMAERHYGVQLEVVHIEEQHAFEAALFDGSADVIIEHIEYLLKAVIHALALLIYRREEAMAIIAQEPMRLMKITDPSELRRQVDSIAELLQIKPYPTIEAIVNTDEIAAQEYGPTVENPLTLWDLHWLRELDDEGFIDDLVALLS